MISESESVQVYDFPPLMQRTDHKMIGFRPSISPHVSLLQLHDFFLPTSGTLAGAMLDHQTGCRHVDSALYLFLTGF